MLSGARWELQLEVESSKSNCSTYDQELLAGMLVLCSQSRLLGTNPIVWLCDQEPVKTFPKGHPPGKAKMKQWWTYLSQFRLTVHHIQGIKKELADYIPCHNFIALLGDSSEALTKEAFQRMVVQLDLGWWVPRPGQNGKQGIERQGVSTLLWDK